MTPYNLIALELGELNECTILCPDCKTQVTIQLAAHVRGNFEGKIASPQTCPGCPRKFDENLIRVLGSLREARVYSQHTPFKVEFHIKEPVKI